MVVLEEFEHDGYSVWYDEMFGHAVTIAREHGTHEFTVWVDLRKTGTRKTLQAASKLALLLTK